MTTTHAAGRHRTTALESGQSTAVRSAHSSRSPCRQAAVTGRARCRMHGWASMHLSRRCDTLCRGNLLCMGFLLEHEPLLEGHRKRLREALGNTLSDEFVDVILGKLVEALRPGLYDQLDEATLNAALATIDSMQPRSELQAILAVQIIATGFAGLRFLRQSHRHMTEDYINVYGAYAIKLLRLQNEMIQTFERYRRGNKQTVEVRHVHIHSGGQGVVGIINPPGDREGGGQE